jgi:predicted O-linked N-acetylglucosamine transferase (SPINDLY family)
LKWVFKPLCFVEKINKYMQVLNSLAVNSIEAAASLENCQFISTNLEQIVDRYETIIDKEDPSSHNYWYLGLAYLLQQRELDAQATWFIPFEDAADSEIASLNRELSDVLDRSASQEFAANNLDNALLISQHLRSINPLHLNNLWRSILLEIKLDQFTPELLLEWELDEILATSSPLELDRELLAELLRSLLIFQSEHTASFIKACLLTYSSTSTEAIEDIGTEVVRVSHRMGTSLFGIEILEFCRTLQPENTKIPSALCREYSNLGYHTQAIKIGRSVYDLYDNLLDKIRASYTLAIVYLSAGNWKKAEPVFQQYQVLIEEFAAGKYDYLDFETNQRTIVSSIFSPYIEDRPASYRQLQNKIAKIYLEHNQAHIKNYNADPVSLVKQSDKIRIGYLGSKLRSHSVGWLSRWLWQYHDRQKFQIFTYCINQDPNDPFYQKWFRDLSHVSYCMVADGERIAAQIRADKIDILIDLDSLTLDTTCQVLAAKPAPVQVSWLGWDATGLPTVDYFIADPYVLPEHAQDYYQEKIWRLPQTYLAVNGFEVGIPTLKRQDLGIPDDAVVYWSGQRGFKRHPNTVRAQMRIIKGVPNSYFIVKGDTDPTIIQEFFGQIAAEEGVDFDRLRFVGSVADEPTHRANLAIADIVLDTFPYNGATTTLETLWMGIPMVTQVGEQFAARNSYTFMLNAGIEEGIAWSEQEYIDWGVKLGLDRDLRDKIAGKLRSGRTTAPVWNAKQFTLDMEQAYHQMWAKYQEQNNNECDSVDRVL